jgi:hypothetical protein
MREPGEKKRKQTHTWCNCEREGKKKKRIPNETIRLETDSEKDLDCMIAFFFSSYSSSSFFHTGFAYPTIIS